MAKSDDSKKKPKPKTETDQTSENSEAQQNDELEKKSGSKASNNDSASDSPSDSPSDAVSDPVPKPTPKDAAESSVEEGSVDNEEVEPQLISKPDEELSDGGLMTETRDNSIVETENKDKNGFLELDKKTEEKIKELAETEERAAAIAEEEEENQPEVGIFAVKTSIGHEKMVANWLAMRTRKRKLNVYAILSPPKLRGYLLLEGVKNKEALQDLIKGVQHARSVVEGFTSLEEIEHFLTPKPLVSGIEEGDVVEIIAGPFKGEKAKVTQIDESKEEITVELFEAMVSIPVTIRGDHVRILQKEAK
jgi:transcriptional antiterminator NusG